MLATLLARISPTMLPKTGEGLRRLVNCTAVVVTVQGLAVQPYTYSTRLCTTCPASTLIRRKDVSTHVRGSMHSRTRVRVPLRVLALGVSVAEYSGQIVLQGFLLECLLGLWWHGVCIWVRHVSTGRPLRPRMSVYPHARGAQSSLRDI